MIFRECASPVRLFVYANQEEVINQWEHDILQTGLSYEQFIELVAAHPCDTVRLYPHRETYLPTGQETEMIFVSVQGEARFAENVQWSSYKTIYSVHRGQQGLELSLQNIEISNEEDRGHGLGAYIFAAQAQAAYQLGFHSIGCLAERKTERNGYYSWPRIGFDWEIHPSMKNRLPQEFGALPRLSDIMGRADARAWWKEHGWSVPADFDTQPTSTSMRVLRSYLQEKGWAWPRKADGTLPIRRVSSLRFDRTVEEPCKCP